MLTTRTRAAKIAWSLAIVVAAASTGVLVDWQAPGIGRYTRDWLMRARGPLPVPEHIAIVGGLLLLGGRAADLLGRRRVLMVGLGLFTAASLACGLATSEGFLIATRAIQGVGAAIMLPAALSIVMN